MQLFDNHISELESSGLDPDTIEASRCYSVDPDRAESILGFPIGCPALVFPYPGANGKPPYQRLKPDIPFQAPEWDKPGKYLSPMKSKNHLYIPTTFRRSTLKDPSRQILFTEGEKKALKAIQEGFDCLSFSGVWNWTIGRESQTRQRLGIPDLDLVVWKGRTVYLCYDSDAVSNPSVHAAERELARHLESRGARVLIARLPAIPGVEKAGLDDFLVHRGPGALQEVLDCAENYSAGQRQLAGDTGSSEGWPAPQPLPDPLPPVEPFKVDLLPVSFQPWISDITERMQCPPAFPAVGAMVALSAVVGRQVAIQPKVADDWQVVPNLWGGVVGRPGLLKTPALQEVLRPLDRLEGGAREEFEVAQRDFEAEKLVREARQKHAKGELQKALREGRDPYQAAEAALITEEVPPTRRRYRTNDPTMEKLGELLNENPRGLLLFRDELTGFLRTLDREGHESDRAFYLEAWNGTGQFVFDRIGRGTIDIKAACISVLGGIQPGPLSSYMRRAARGGQDDDGLVQRFQLVVWPDPPGTWKDIDRQPDMAARQRAFEVFERLDHIDSTSIGAEVYDEEGFLPFLRFAPEAQEIFTGWRSELEHRLRGDDLPPMLEAYLAKFRSLIPSLALLSHLADTQSGPVGEDSLLQALAWGEYLESHAKRVYAPSLSPSAGVAAALAKRICRGDLGTEFALYDVYKKGWSGLCERDEVEDGLELLEDLDWVRKTETPTAGRPRKRYLVNPHIGRK